MEEQQNKKNGFWKGLATGLAVAIILGIAGFFIYTSKIEIPEPEVTPTPTKAAQGPTLAPNENIFTSITNDQLLAKIKSIKQMIGEKALYESAEEDVIDGIYAGVLSSLHDAYAVYYNRQDMNSMMEETSGTYCGIGALVSQNVYTGIITIVRPFKEGPAFKAGMHKGDRILFVDEMDVTGMELSEVVKYMKGEPGTKVNITVLRDEEQIVLNITRAKVEVETVEYEMLDDNVGYILVTEFDQVTVEQFKKAIAELEKQGMEQLVIDLRDNPGGLVDSAVKMVDRIITTGVVVYTEDKNHNKSCDYATTAQHLDIPIALLVNENSASASEIFTGALRDYEKAIIVGTNTYGKGIVQVITYLEDMSGIKFTIAEYFSPKGNAVHGIGIKPDFEVELDDDLKSLSEIPRDRDSQLKKAIEELKKQSK